MKEVSVPEVARGSHIDKIDALLTAFEKGKAVEFEGIENPSSFRACLAAALAKNPRYKAIKGLVMRGKTTGPNSMILWFENRKEAIPYKSS